MINPNQPDFTNHPAHPMRKKIEQRLISGAEQPVISIVTPFYNTGPVFSDSALSILNQTLQQWEWLIINDGTTTQPGLDILQEYRQLDPRIRVIDLPENCGVSAARNTGVTHARCEYVLFLDSDDLIEPTAAEKWWWYLETHPECSFIASYHVAFGGLNYLWTGGFHDGWMNTERNRISIILMARKSTYTAVGGFDESMRRGLEDWDFWMKCASRGFWGATIPEYLAWYRVRPDHSDRWESLDEQHLNEYQAELKQKYPNLTNESFPTLTETVNYDLTEVDLESPAFNQIQKDRPHLLIILPWLVTGGAERFTLNLMDQLMERNWDVSIVTTAQSENAWLHEFEARTPFFFNLPNFLPIKDHPRFLGYLMQSRHFDAVLLQGSLEGYRYIPALRAFSPETPILDFLHFVTPEWMEGGFPKLSLLYQDMIDFTLTSCQQVRDWMLEAGAEAEKVAACYIGVDTQTWKPDASRRARVRDSLGIGAADPVILFAARLEEQKRPDVLIKTLIKLKEQGDAFHAVVAGEGSMRGYLDAEVKKHELQDRIHLLGNVSAEKMPELMAAADIFFLPSRNEGISQALYEAMATGLMVVSAQVGGQAELVTPDCGVLYAHQAGKDEAEAYAQILHDLLGDPQRQQEMASASRRRVSEQFSLVRMGECIHNHLRDVIEQKKASPVTQLTTAEKQAIERETRAQVEYLQARQRQRWLEREYSALITPQPPSHWFYLWIRQILFPTYQRVSNYKAATWTARLVKKVKARLVKTA